jgi:branched-chain amino acid transport system permease protein
VINFIQVLALGLLAGGLYALAASGLTLVFGVMKVINVAHGALLILGAYLTWAFWRHTGVDPLLLILVTTPALFALGWLGYRLFVQRVRGAPAMSVLLTFSMALVIQGILGEIWSNNFRTVITSYSNHSFHVGSIVLPKERVFACGIAVAILVMLWLLLTRTWLGRAIRASAENPQGAALIGIDLGSVAALTFAIGVATTGAGGSLLSLSSFFPSSHYLWISRLLGIIVLGGMGSLSGAFVGALLMGVAEAMVANYVPNGLAWVTAVPYMVIFVVLLLRPRGIFGAGTREDVATI